ncbi:MAG: 2-amino-4-hydroxy-6-hydroxymethyldihydropteridine diphosphokinase [Hyphomonadaceae bacterium]|nr:2-amino-4-hydroxy-6-hydroxymethyldihydropteridine diphosphokinase [Hyphomonadaceae bacterium]
MRAGDLPQSTGGSTGPLAVVALGANLPHRGLAGAALLAAAAEAVAAAGFRVLARSSVWTSPAWPPSDQPPFVNAVLLAESPTQDPAAALALLLSVEAAFGRERRAKWGPRTLDLDLIDFAGLVRPTPPPTLPHPRSHERAFVLAPLVEAAPDWRHPTLGRSAAALLAALPEGQGIARLGPLA